MKQFFILSVILLTVVAFSYCKKEGIYTPDKKISKMKCSNTHPVALRV